METAFLFSPDRNQRLVCSTLSHRKLISFVDISLIVLCFYDARLCLRLRFDRRIIEKYILSVILVFDEEREERRER